MATERTGVARRLQEFLHNESAGGMVMIGFAILAMGIANSPLAGWYGEFKELPVLGFTLDHFVKDVLMVWFFLLVGMELKREMLEGFLATRSQKILPLIAAAGGVVTPALIYVLLNNGVPAHASGWAIPTATDIAFAVCILSLVSKRVPASAKIFLLAIAIYDDLAAILIIAFFYSSGIAWEPMAVAACVSLGLFLLNRLNVGALMPYLLLGVVLWEAIHQAGIHTTIAGVIVGLAIPLRLGGKRSESPLNQFVDWLHPFVAFFILPLFAFVSAGVALGGISPSALLDPLPIGIALGLFVGKQIGIFGTTFAAVKLGFAPRPEGANWLTLYGVSILAGIGFTMSLFVGFLAFTDPMLHNEIKLGVIVGSLLSTLWGAIVLRRALRPL